MARELPRFTESQRERLAKLLLCEQVDELEKALPSCQALLLKPVAMMTVRGKLNDVVRGLRLAHRAASGESSASSEVRTRLGLAAIQSSSSAFEAVARIAQLLKEAESALRALPRAQRRWRRANPLAIARVREALLDGFVAHHAELAKKLPKGHRLPLPPYRERHLSEVTELVFEALELRGRNNETLAPERALKAYTKRQRNGRQVP